MRVEGATVSEKLALEIFKTGKSTDQTKHTKQDLKEL
jgi:hypothetical protein